MTQFFALYNNFMLYLLNSYRSDINTKLENLTRYEFEEHRKFIDDIKKNISRYLEGKQYIEDFLITLYRKKDEIIKIYIKLKEELSKLIDKQLNTILMNDIKFLEYFYEKKKSINSRNPKRNRKHG